MQMHFYIEFMKICFLALFIWHVQSFAAMPAAQLLPLPNSEFTAKCSDGNMILRNHEIKVVNKQISIVEEVFSPHGNKVTTLEPWSRLTLAPTVSDAKGEHIESKLVSGNLQNFNFSAGTKFSGQISQKVTKNGKTNQSDMQITLTVGQRLKVQFKGEAMDAYPVDMFKTSLKGEKIQTASFKYVLKLQQPYSMTIWHPKQKTPYGCTLTDYKILAAAKAK